MLEEPLYWIGATLPMRLFLAIFLIFVAVCGLLVWWVAS